MLIFQISPEGKSMHWYKQQSNFLKYRFGDDWKLVAGLLAATSPQVAFKTSWNFSMSIWDEIQDGKEPDLSGFMRSHRLNIERVLKGEELSGDKVSRFYRNLIGDLEVVTVDSWMIKLWNIDCGSHKSPWPAMYRKLERAFQRWARSKGEKPANMQAILWNYIRNKEGKKPVSFALIEEEMAAPF